MENKALNLENKRKSIKVFNTNVKNMLFALMDDVRIKESAKNINYYYLECDDEKCEASLIEIKDLLKQEQNKNDILNYYWSEYEKDSEQYRLCMFFKDFDYSSGNLHVLPGMVQLWKRCNYAKEECFVSGKKKKITEKYCSGGQSYCEGGWRPCGYNDNTYTRDIRIIWGISIAEKKMHKKMFYKCQAISFWDSMLSDKKYAPANWLEGKFSEAFYGQLKRILYEDMDRQEGVKIRNGRGTYYLYRWEVKEDLVRTYYKLIYVKKYGWFCIFD